MQRWSIRLSSPRSGAERWKQRSSAITLWRDPTLNNDLCSSLCSEKGICSVDESSDRFLLLRVHSCTSAWFVVISQWYHSRLYFRWYLEPNSVWFSSRWTDTYRGFLVPPHLHTWSRGIGCVWWFCRTVHGSSWDEQWKQTNTQWITSKWGFPLF